VNTAVPSLHGGPLEITFTNPLTKKRKILIVDSMILSVKNYKLINKCFYVSSNQIKLNLILPFYKKLENRII